jgi:hypothetical protein
MIRQICLVVTTCFFICLVSGCSTPTKEKAQTKLTNKEIESKVKVTESTNKDEIHAPVPTFKCTLERYALQLFGDESPSYFTVSHGEKNYTYKFERPWNAHSKVRLVKIGASGAVFAVFEEQQGNHYIYQFIQCKRGLGKVVTLDNGYLPIKFEHADKGCRLLAYDWWDDESGARAIAPEVVLIWKGNRFGLDEKAMRDKAPNNAEINEQLKQFKLEGNWPSVELDGLLVDLIYSGKEKRAKEVLEHCWPKNVAGKRRHWNEIKNKVKRSPYYNEISKANRRTIV